MVLAVFLRYQYLLVMLLLIYLCAGLAGCGSTPEQTAQSDSKFSQGVSGQWIQFGVLLTVQRIELLDADGVLEPAMRMDLVLDDGRSVVVEQPLSKAGELSPGNRVRLLQIGGYSQGTFWPYQQSSEDEPVNAAQ